MVDKMNFAQFAAPCVDAEAINNTDNVKKHGTVIRPIVKFVIVFFVWQTLCWHCCLKAFG